MHFLIGTFSMQRMIYISWHLSNNIFLKLQLIYRWMLTVPHVCLQVCVSYAVWAPLCMLICNNNASHMDINLSKNV